jgi:L-lysine 6-transaminase
MSESAQEMDYTFMSARGKGVEPESSSGMLPASGVHASLARHMLVDGFDIVLDLAASHGSTLVDARDGTTYLDLFTFFGSSALGMNHPGLTKDPGFRARLLEAAFNKPSNSDIYTVAMARFVETFARVLGDPGLPHLFFVEGGALAVENAIKVTFDWKSRWNEAHGRDPGLGTKVLHLEYAFHGRSGYTMSLTNTEPNKVARFPKFDWPRIPSPYLREGSDVVVCEAEALAAARAAFEAHPHDIACFIMETIQGEGGDHHFRPEFLQAMQALCHKYDALFVLDEVQSGCGITGTAWAFQQMCVQPDVIAFGKKTQVCGIMAGGRVDEVPDNVFTVSSRINSTWGGNLTDMVRAQRILEIIERDGLIARASVLGEHLRRRLTRLASRHETVRQVRGRGLMCAFSLPDMKMRDQVLTAMRNEEHVLLLGCGTRSIRFRLALTVTEAELEAGVAALERVLNRANLLDDRVAGLHMTATSANPVRLSPPAAGR